MQVIKPKEIIEEISNLKTGEKYNNDEEWKAKGIPESEVRKDVRVIQGLTTGHPISLIIYNEDHRSKDYLEINRTEILSRMDEIKKELEMLHSF